LCIVAFEVLNGAPGDARGGTGRGLELDTPRVIYRARRVRLEPTRVPIDAAGRRSARATARPPGQHRGAQRRGTLLLISNALGREDAHLCPRPRAS
jgi:hypothetical protein